MHLQFILRGGSVSIGEVSPWWWVVLCTGGQKWYCAQVGRYGTVHRWAELILCTGGQRWYNGTVHRWADMVLCTGGQEQRGASGCVHRCSGKCATDDVGVGEGGGSGRYGSLCLTRMLRPDALTPHLHQPYPLLLLKANFALQNQSSSSRTDNCQPPQKATSKGVWLVTCSEV